MNASILPDDEIDFAVDPEAEQLIEDARREVIEDRSMDHNDSRFGGEFNAGTGMKFTGPQREGAQEARPARQERAPVDDPEIPAELRGKSAAEIAREYRKLDRQIGINGSEIGQLRRVAAEAAAEAAAAPAVPARYAGVDEDAEFFARPKTAVEKVISNHPIIQSLKSAITETAQRKATQQFLNEYPDAEKTMADPAFREWAAKSPIRMQLLTKAHSEYDLDSAREVFGTWKALSARETSSGSNSGKKVYRRSDIRRLAETDPTRYEALADEIALAYAQGRVKDV